MKELTEKQKQLLQLLSDGSTQKEIAGTMKLSERRVRAMLRVLRNIFNCTNNEKLIKLCTQASQIH